MKLTLGPLVVLSVATLVSTSTGRARDPHQIFQRLSRGTQELIRDTAQKVRGIPYSREFTGPRQHEFVMEYEFGQILAKQLPLLEGSRECAYCEGDRGCIRKCATALTKLVTLAIWDNYNVDGLHCRVFRVIGVSVPFFYWSRCLKKRAGAIDFHHSDLFFPLLGLFQSDQQPANSSTEPCRYINGVDPKCVLPSLDETDMQALGIPSDNEFERSSSASRISSSSAEPRREALSEEDGAPEASRALTMGEELERLLIKELPVNMAALGELLESAPEEIMPALLTKVTSMAQNLKTTDRTRVAVLVGQLGGTDLGRILLKDNTECDELVQQLYDRLVMAPTGSGSQSQRRPIPNARQCKERMKRNQQVVPSGKLLRQLEVLFVASGCYEKAAGVPLCRHIMSPIVEVLDYSPSNLQEVPMGRVPNIMQLYLLRKPGVPPETKRAFFIANELNPQVIVDAVQAIDFQRKESSDLRKHCAPGELCAAAFHLIEQPPVTPEITFCVPPESQTFTFSDRLLERIYAKATKRTKRDKLVRATIAALALCHSEAVDDLAQAPSTLPAHFNQAAEAFCAAQNGKVPKHVMIPAE